MDFVSWFYPTQELFPTAISHTFSFQPANPSKETLPTRQMSHATMSRVVHITYWDLQVTKGKLLHFCNAMKVYLQICPELIRDGWNSDTFSSELLNTFFLNLQ